MRRESPFALAWLLCLANAQQQAMHVVELHHSDVATEDLLKVFASFGVDSSQTAPLVQKVAQEGKAVVISGPKESCEAAAKQFDGIGMKTVVRPLSAADRPSEYSGSDVIEADTARFKELMADRTGGTLVTFYAPCAVL